MKHCPFLYILCNHRKITRNYIIIFLAFRGFLVNKYKEKLYEESGLPNQARVLLKTAKMEKVICNWSFDVIGTTFQLQKSRLKVVYQLSQHYPEQSGPKSGRSISQKVSIDRRLRLLKKPCFWLVCVPEFIIIYLCDWRG